MIALKALLFVVFGSNLISCYPNTIYGTKRYGRSTYGSSFDPYESYVRSQRYPYGYYPSYVQYYPEEYYYNQDTYPMYYVSPRTSNDIYQTNLPYYYADIQPSRSKYDYYNYMDPTVNDQNRLVQDYEREQRERSQPIGHEIQYENDLNSDADVSIDDTNAAFLNNLISDQLYQRSYQPYNSKNTYYEQDPYDYTADEADAITFPSKWDDIPYDPPINVEDEDVKELKELPKKQKQRKARKQRKQRQNKYVKEADISKRSDDIVVYTDRKPVVKDVIITEAPTTTTESPRRNSRGQKEEVLMRPATPVRHPFSESILDMFSQQEERKRSPSVYDTIRHMLEMEKKYDEIRPTRSEDIGEAKKKRIISSEDSLTKQLSVLKKAQ
ncbi:uncharacterized protein LOC143204416 [Rhynchophorus ferrugineus]|uniref:uncharacterized protein LOC143204416 n=1 Tax=Rhynchophorus ferrugineus TaxID=354439 RepID=UPI003FCD0632